MTGATEHFDLRRVDCVDDPVISSRFSRIWASKRFAESGSQAAKKLEELHLAARLQQERRDPHRNFPV